ncbi:MAG: autotransporter domain-containing protein [Steroidobacteraceae bacterium]
MKSATCLSALAAATLGATLLAGPAAATDFSAAWFFGDSLSDTGNIGRFTTARPGSPGTVWTEALAAKLGLEAVPVAGGGTDWAFGGARVGADLGPIKSLMTQVTSYLALSGGKADPNALYSVWAGANNINDATVIPPAQIPGYLYLTTAQEVAMITALHDAGARYIIVPTLPDMGLTPAAAFAGPAAAAGLTTLVSNYNTMLYGQLRNAGIGVIAPDTFNLIHEVEANPHAYGIFVTTAGWACSSANPPAGQVIGGAAACALAPINPPGDASLFMFADGIHPSSVTHRILADYVYSVVVAPGAMSMLTETAVRTRSTLDEIVAAESVLGGETSRYWVAADGGKLEYGSGADVPADGKPLGFTFGVDRGTRLGRLGVAVNLGQVRPSLAGIGDYRQEQQSLSVYGSHAFGGLQLGLAATLGHLSYDIRRDVALGPATRHIESSTSGANVSLGILAQYALHSGGVEHGPLLGIDVQHVDVSGFTESKAAGASTSMTFGSQQRNAYIGRLGYQLAFNSGDWTPYARASYEHDFASKDRSIDASLASVTDSGWTMPAVRIDVDAANVALGTRWRLADDVQAWAEVGGAFGRSDVTQYGARIGLRFGH